MAAHRPAFPTPRGATGGCPPDTVCGGRPRDPRGDGKSDSKGGVGFGIIRDRAQRLFLPLHPLRPLGLNFFNAEGAEVRRGTQRIL